ncbi:MAG: hypothetical protein ACREHG_00155 [Candidatus Saccharimonadales bacterium]
MQLTLPIFPVGTKLISASVGVYEKDGVVQYIINGMPVFNHAKEDHQAFRYFTSNLIDQGLCRKVDIKNCFGVSEDSVTRNYKKFKEERESGFFGSDNRHGTCHKIIGERRERIQAMLDKGQSVNSIAKKESVAEGSIRYAIRKGYLKKTLQEP